MNLYFIHAGICVNIAGNLHAVYVGSRGVGKRAFERIEHTGGLKTGIAVQNIKILVFKIVKAGYKGTISVLLCLELKYLSLIGINFVFCGSR